MRTSVACAGMTGSGAVCAAADIRRDVEGSLVRDGPSQGRDRAEGEENINFEL
jgi:hypothetical protein